MLQGEIVQWVIYAAMVAGGWFLRHYGVFANQTGAAPGVAGAEKPRPPAAAGAAAVQSAASEPPDLHRILLAALLKEKFPTLDLTGKV